MSAPNDSFLAALTALSKDQIQQAGSRYTPGVDADAPNLQIESLSTVIKNVACGAGARARFESVLNGFSEAWDQAKHCSQRSDTIQQRVDDARVFLPLMMGRLRKREANAGVEWSDMLSSIESDLLADREHWHKEEDKLRPDDRDTANSSARSSIRDNIYSIGRCLAVLEEEKEYIQSPPFKSLFDPNLLICGEWGTGKTHQMCDFTKSRIGCGLPTVLVLSKNFQGDVIAEICSRIEAGRTAIDIFNRLEQLACEKAERAIVIVDGVNEGSRREWRKAVTTLLALVADCPNIGLIITCRTPFESIAIGEKDLEKFHQVVHRGFDNQEFDAQAAFFQHYNLPLPEVPLLDTEFSRPLTLKLICQSLQNLSDKKLAQGFAGIASGQKGMTFVFESFVKCVGKQIEHRFGLRTKGCWELLKGNDQIPDRRAAGFAPCMAEKSRSYVLQSEAARILSANFPAWTPALRRQLLETFRINGLIDEDVVWYATKSGPKSRIVYRLPYQRFSDHLIARCLLNTHLDVSSVAAIKRSFKGRSPLARIFRMSNRNSREYAEPGLVQALITEFPERVKKKLPSKLRELYFVLPKIAQNANAYFNPFVEGIFWRNPTAFSQGTRSVINHYLQAGSWLWEQMTDALVAVSFKTRHPYHARRLYDSLARYPMPERDLRWSEYLRRGYVSPTIRRLLTWAGKLSTANMTKNSAKELVVLLSLVLTTVVRSDRDLATKALVLIGESYPEVLFSHTETSLDFNDPYVPERMLAAAYGTTMSLVDSEAAAAFRPLLGKLAKTLYLRMFAPDARKATHHTLMRDYSLGIIENAQRVGCLTLPNSACRNLAAPFPTIPSTFSSDGTPDPTVEEAIDGAIQMDFGNYTIGSLIPSRGNYDNEDPDYVQVRAKIERRMFDLGYQAEKFKAADDEIGRVSWNASNEKKVDRYGKKYSWIAYFEMRGEREAVGKLSEWQLGQRTPDCGVDPSFPKPPTSWGPPIPDLFGNPDEEISDWVEGGYIPDWRPLLVIPEINGHQGDWVLVQGHIHDIEERLSREIFAFQRGVFIASGDVRGFKEQFLSVEYPGNDVIPRGASEHYLYAGEAGRRRNFAGHLYQPNGQYGQQIEGAFSQYPRANPRKGTSGIEIEIPYISFDWEPHQSPHNKFSGFDLPAPSLIQHLGLSSRNREIDFYDIDGKPGTLYRETGGGWDKKQHSLLYIRADLLLRYLTETRQVLVWCNWGERDWLKRFGDHAIIHSPVRRKICQAHDHVHRSFFQWSADDRKILD